MEKITLKPIVKELLYKADEVNTHFDVMSYSGTNTQEKTLGSLCLVGHVRFEEEDLGYIIGLIGSLAKREYYSEQSLRAQNPRTAFENTLKKLNEVLEDFFKNKKFSLNLGLAALAGDQIFISKLGKFKVGLARDGQHIDVLNNITLFQKSAEPEQQFSNIISGRLQPRDKIFAFYPGRPITSRERMLQNVLIKESQQNFLDKIGLLAQSIDTFSCCGVHIAMEQIKEIPLQMPELAVTLAALSNGHTADSELSGATAKPRVIAAELSVSKKNNLLRTMQNSVAKLKGIRGFMVIAVVILIPLFTAVAIRSRNDSSGVKAIYQSSIENVKLIQAKLAQNDLNEARALIQQTLSNIRPYNDENIAALRNELVASLDGVDHASAVIPQLVGILSEDKTGIALAFENGSPTVLYNGSELLSINGKEYTLSDPVTGTDASLYEGNLYVLAGEIIYKYGDALSGGTKRTEWGTPDTRLQSIAVDGNVYGLTADGSIVMYFKGKRESSFNPELPFSGASQIATMKDSRLLYLSNPSDKRLYAIDKTSGTLQLTYKLDSIGELKDIALSSEGNVWLISADNKVWLIRATAVQP